MIQVTAEHHRARDSLQAILTAAGGKNRFDEPNFRISWGMEAPYNNRWILERWLPPEVFGTPENWNARETKVLVFPYRGSYEHCFTFENPDGSFMQITGAAARHIVSGILYGQQNFSDTERKAALYRREEKKDSDYTKFAMDVLNDENKFEGQPHIYVP